MDKRELENDIITELKKNKYGKKDQSRAIMCKLLSYKDKAKVLQNCKNLKRSHICINEDSCQATLYYRGELWKEVNINVRSINKNFEAFTELYSKLNHIFIAICFSETWESEENINKSSTFQLKIVINQVRSSRKGRGLCIFIHESLCYKLRKDLSINSKATESLFTEISNKKANSLIFHAIYRVKK